MHKCEIKNRSRITETTKREVTSRDLSFVGEQKKFCEETGEELITA